MAQKCHTRFGERDGGDTPAARAVACRAAPADTPSQRSHRGQAQPRSFSLAGKVLFALVVEAPDVGEMLRRDGHAVGGDVEHDPLLPILEHGNVDRRRVLGVELLCVVQDLVQGQLDGARRQQEACLGQRLGAMDTYALDAQGLADLEYCLLQLRRRVPLVGRGEARRVQIGEHVLEGLAQADGALQRRRRELCHVLLRHPAPQAGQHAQQRRAYLVPDHLVETAHVPLHGNLFRHVR